MAIVAKASSTVRNKNFLIILLCGGFLCMFAYDGMLGYPKKNDKIVEKLVEPRYNIRTEDLPEINEWNERGKASGKGGWNSSSDMQRDSMYNLILTNHVEGFHSRTDVQTQVYITIGLAVATAAALWWFVRCQKRRVIADETTVSPAPGVVIPWESIKRVDNTRWKSGYVTITYTGPGGADETATFDDYVVNRKALIEILKLMETKAVNAEFVPKEQPV